VQGVPMVSSCVAERFGPASYDVEAVISGWLLLLSVYQKSMDVLFEAITTLVVALLQELFE